MIMRRASKTLNHTILALTFACALTSIPAVRAAESITQPSTSGGSDAATELLRPTQPSTRNVTMSDSDQVKASLERYFKNSQTAAAIAAAMPDKLSAVPKHKKRIFVLTSGPYLHVDAAAGLLILLREAARKYNAFELTECYDSNEVHADTLKPYDAIIINNSQARGKFTEYVVSYVEAGGGFLGNHGTGHAGDGIGKLLGTITYGLPKKGPGWLAFPLKIVEPDNPLMAAFRTEGTPIHFTFKYTDESGQKQSVTKDVQMPHEHGGELNVPIMDPAALADKVNPIRILMEVDLDNPAKELWALKQTSTLCPLIWIRRYGKGRVFYSEFDHVITGFTIPAINHNILDGLQYVLGDLTVDDLPRISSNVAESFTQPVK